jgi:hypothetical protein
VSRWSHRAATRITAHPPGESWWARFAAALRIDSDPPLAARRIRLPGPRRSRVRRACTSRPTSCQDRSSCNEPNRRAAGQNRPARRARCRRWDNGSARDESSNLRGLDTRRRRWSNSARARCQPLLQPALRAANFALLGEPKGGMKAQPFGRRAGHDRFVASAVPGSLRTNASEVHPSDDEPQVPVPLLAAAQTRLARRYDRPLVTPLGERSI